MMSPQFLLVGEDQRIILKPADLIFQRTPTLKGWLIRLSQTRILEGKTYANHVAGIGPSIKKVIEALWHVRETPLEKWISAEPDFEIWRYSAIEDNERDQIANRASEYVGRDYGWWKLGLHLADEAISKPLPWDVFLFRRLMFVDRYPICNWVWAYAYHAYGVDFGKDPKVLNPDSMHDWVKKCELWKMVFKKAAPEAIKQGGKS